MEENSVRCQDTLLSALESLLSKEAKSRRGRTFEESDIHSSDLRVSEKTNLCEAGNNVDRTKKEDRIWMFTTNYVGKDPVFKTRTRWTRWGSNSRRCSVRFLRGTSSTVLFSWWQPPHALQTSVLPSGFHSVLFGKLHRLKRWLEENKNQKTTNVDYDFSGVTKTHTCIVVQAGGHCGGGHCGPCDRWPLPGLQESA